MRDRRRVAERGRCRRGHFPAILAPAQREGGRAARRSDGAALRPARAHARTGGRPPSAPSVARSLYSTLDRIRRMSGLCWIKESLEYLMGNDS